MMKKTQIIDSLINGLFSVGCFIGIYLCHEFLLNIGDNTIIIAAFGAAAVLGFSEQTQDVLFIKILIVSGLSAFLGVSFIFSHLNFIYQVSLAIGSCILLLNLTGINYPPAGAIVLIPLLSDYEIKELGYTYVLCPTLTGITIIYLFSILKRTIKPITNYGK